MAPLLMTQDPRRFKPTNALILGKTGGDRTDKTSIIAMRYRPRPIIVVAASKVIIQRGLCCRRRERQTSPVLLHDLRVAHHRRQSHFVFWQERTQPEALCVEGNKVHCGHESLTMVSAPTHFVIPQLLWRKDKLKIMSAAS